MNKIILLLILSINLFMGSLFASPINDIDEDPWLRTWLFVGPFDNYEMAEKVSDSLWNSSFDEIIEYSNSKEHIEHHKLTSNSSTARHSVHQYYPDSNEDFIIGFSLIQSKKKVKAYYNQNLHPWDEITFYLGNELIIEKSGESFNWKEVNLNKGTNIGRLIFQLEPDAISFNQNFSNEFSIGIFKQDFITTLKGKITFNNKTVSDASIEITTPKGLAFQIMSDRSGRFEHRIINQAYGDELNIYCFKDKLKFSSVIKIEKDYNLSEMEIELEEYYDSISGKVMTLFDDEPQSDILVKLLDVTTDVVTSKVFTENSGKFKFNNIPKGKYQISIETDVGVFYAKENNGEKTNITIGRKKKLADDVKIKIPQINKGLWEQLNFIKGLKSDYVYDIHVDNHNKIWFACHTGLTVYDGNKYKNFGKKDGLTGGAVVKVFEYSKGLIWIVERNEYNGGGGIKTINNNYEVENFLLKHDLKEIGFSTINEDNEGRMIFGGQAGFFIFDGNEIKTLKYGQGLGSGHITDIFIDNDNYWLGTTDGLVHFNGSNYNNLGPVDGLGFNSYVRKISKSNKGNLLISVGHFRDFGQPNGNFTSSLYAYDGLSFNIVDDLNHTSNINDIFHDENLMLYNSGNKIVLYDGNFQQTISPYWSKICL